MAENITSWTQKVAAAVPLCPDPVIERAVLETCRDFCKETLLWDENQLTAIDIVSGTHTYTLTSSDGDIVDVDYARVDDVPITPISINEINRRRVQWRDSTSTRSRWYIVGMTDEIRLVYTPSENITGGLEVWVCLMPLKTATTVPDFLYRDYEDCITNGAIGRLLEVPGMKWSNLEMANYFNLKYKDKRNGARSKKFTGRTRYEIKAVGNYFA